jgi:hypothetical protein
MKRYIVIDIGCLECGNPTDIEGIYATQAEAETTGAEARTKLDDGDTFGDWHGDHKLVWYQIDVPPLINEGPTDNFGLVSNPNPQPSMRCD